MTGERITTAGAGGTYATANLWEGDTDNDLVALDIVETVELLDDVMSGYLVVAGAVTDATRFRRIRPVAGKECRGLLGTGVRYSSGIDLDESYARLADIEISDTGQGGLALGRNASATGCLVERVIVANPATDTCLRISTGSHTIRNSIFYGSPETYARFPGAYGGSVGAQKFHDCVFAANAGQGILAGAGTAECVNCVAVLNGDPDFQGTITGSNNMSEDGTAPGAASVTGISPTATFADAVGPSYDFHLKAGSPAVGAGLNLSAQFTDDVDGQTRPPLWDCGADQHRFAPTAPSGLAATSRTETAIALGWTDNSSDEDGYKVERAPDVSGSAGAYAQVGQTAAGATEFTDSGLTAGTYWYRVRGFNPAGDGAASAAVKVKTGPSPRTPVGGGAHLARPMRLRFKVSDQASMRAAGLLDDVFREPALSGTGEGVGSSTTWTTTDKTVRGQFEFVKVEQDQGDAGRVATVKGRCYVLARDADDAGIVRDDGSLSVKMDDELSEVTDVRGSGRYALGNGHRVVTVKGSGDAGPRPAIYVIETEEIAVRRS